MAAVSVPDTCLHLDGDDRGEVSGSEAPTGKEADTTRVAAQILGLRDLVHLPLSCAPQGSCTSGSPAPCQQCLITIHVIFVDTNAEHDLWPPGSSEVQPEQRNSKAQSSGMSQLKRQTHNRVISIIGCLQRACHSLLLASISALE